MKHLMTLAGVLAIGAAMPALAETDKGEKAEMKAEHYFKKIDTDGNGSISKSENDAFGQKMFDEADADKNNMISQEEMTAHKKKEMQEFKEQKQSMNEKQ